MTAPISTPPISTVWTEHRQVPLSLYRNYRYARSRDAARGGTWGLLGPATATPSRGGWATSVRGGAAGQAVYAPCQTSRNRRSIGEDMKTVTDSVRREYEALYLNRNALRDVVRTSLHRVPRVPVADVLDEAFVDLWHDVTEGSVDGPLQACVNKYINRAGWRIARRQLRLNQHEQQYGLDVGESLPPEQTEMYGYRETTPERARFAADFDNAVRSLTPKQREAFILTELRGLSQREAAGILGISQASVQERVERATEAVRTTLEGAA